MTAFAYYLLKVIICSGILFLYYRVALRNKLFHQWNRFYLLISILISLLAPIVQFSIIQFTSEESNKAIQILQAFQSADGYLEEVTVSGNKGISAHQWLMITYLAISLVLFLYLLLSLRKIFTIIRSHSIQWIEKIKFISTKVPGTPFSFFNFIIWNAGIDLHTETGKQIFQHELVHVKEKHSLDKIMVQLVLVAFWCNPFFWLIRRELKLIHEFIADKKAVGEYGTTALAAMILGSAYPAQFSSITNQFFQTSIKRRLAMLSKIQNPRINYVSRILALPMLAATVLAFTLRTQHVLAPVQLEKPFTVVIDAGHGNGANGKHSGVAVGGVSEDAIVLSIANKIKKMNGNDQLKIVLTRITDNLMDLRTRVEIARKNKADLFISLHIGAAVANPAPGSASEKSLTAGFGVYVSNKQPVYQQQSELFGSVLRQELNSLYPTNPYLIKRKVGIFVVDQNVCPSVLVECGFLTNEKDRQFITKDQNQEAVAQRILKAIEQYALNQTKTGKVNTGAAPQKQETSVLTLINQGGQKKAGTVATGAKDPLFIVDGQEWSKEDVEKINTATISSITILKDESAVRLYGKKGANGVIVINLKTKGANDYITFKKNGDQEANRNLTSDSSINEFRFDIRTDQALLDTVPKKEPLFTKVETEASIDKDEWSAFLRKNLQSVIENAAKNGMKPGTYSVKLKFIVKKDGSITDIEALNDPGHELAEKTVGFMKDSPKWHPGLQNGVPVNSYQTKAVTFVIQEQ